MVLIGYSGYISSFWNQMDLLTSIAVIGVAVMRMATELGRALNGYITSQTVQQILAVLGRDGAYYSFDDDQAAEANEWSRNLYAVVVLLVYLRFFDLLTYSPRLGVLTIIIKRMMDDVLSWAAVVGCAGLNGLVDHRRQHLPLLLDVPDVAQHPGIRDLDPAPAAEQRAGRHQALQLDRAAVRERQAGVAQAPNQLDIDAADAGDVNLGERLLERLHPRDAEAAGDEHVRPAPVAADGQRVAEQAKGGEGAEVVVKEHSRHERGS